MTICHTPALAGGARGDHRDFAQSWLNWAREKKLLNSFFLCVLCGKKVLYTNEEVCMNPGEYFLEERAIEANLGRETVRVVVKNSGDRPVQIGSHFHFFEVNRALLFERKSAYGMRLNIPAGTAVRFEPGDEKEVELVALGGARVVHGHRGLVNGALDDPRVREKALAQQAAESPTLGKDK
jgi:urease subunit beta